MIAHNGLALLRKIPLYFAVDIGPVFTYNTTVKAITNGP